VALVAVPEFQVVVDEIDRSCSLLGLESAPGGQAAFARLDVGHDEGLGSTKAKAVFRLGAISDVATQTQFSGPLPFLLLWCRFAVGKSS
jgi:hypothetical protein